MQRLFVATIKNPNIFMWLFLVLAYSQSITVEPVRIDEYTGRKFTFFSDPDGLPLELYEL